MRMIIVGSGPKWFDGERWTDDANQARRYDVDNGEQPPRELFGGTLRWALIGPYRYAIWADAYEVHHVGRWVDD